MTIKFTVPRAGPGRGQVDLGPRCRRRRSRTRLPNRRHCVTQARRTIKTRTRRRRPPGPGSSNQAETAPGSPRRTRSHGPAVAVTAATVTVPARGLLRVTAAVLRRLPGGARSYRRHAATNHPRGPRRGGRSRIVDLRRVRDPATAPSRDAAERR